MDILAVSYFLLFWIVAFGLLVVAREVEKNIAAERTTWVRLLVLVPQGISHPFTEHRPHEIENSTELYKRLHELHIPFTLEVAVHTVGEEIHFYISTPRLHARRVRALIQTLWHTSSVVQADEYELWLDVPTEKDAHVAIGYLGQARSYLVPLQTARRGHFEPLTGVLRHLANLSAVGEAGALQWVVREADAGLMNDIRTHLERLRRGEYHPSRHIHEHFILTPESLGLLEEKVRSPLFAVNCRLVTASADGNATELLEKLANHIEASSVTDNQHNHFKLIRPKNNSKALAEFFARRFEPAQTMILTAQELATYIHLPGPRTPSPKIRRS